MRLQMMFVKCHYRLFQFFAFVTAGCHLNAHFMFQIAQINRGNIVLCAVEVDKLPIERDVQELAKQILALFGRVKIAAFVSGLNGLVNFIKLASDEF